MMTLLNNLGNRTQKDEFTKIKVKEKKNQEKIREKNKNFIKMLIKLYI